MKKFLLVLVALSAVSLSSVSAFAADSQTPALVLQEVPVSSEILESVESVVTHEDGTVETLTPEYKLYEVVNNSRSISDGIQYKIEVRQRYTNPLSRSTGSDSDYDSAKADADVTGVIWFTSKASGDILDRAKIDFTQGSGVQVYNRTMYYKGNGTSGTNERSKSIGLHHDQEFTGVKGGPASGVTVRVKADVESYGVTDTLSISMRS